MKKLNTQMIIKADKDVQNDPSYGPEEILISTFFNHFPKNTDATIVAAKVAIIDTTNNTNISRYKSKLSLCAATTMYTFMEETTTPFSTMY